jgi:hypothetical protein
MPTSTVNRPTKPLDRVRSIRLRRFKRIVDASFDLKDVNVLVGGNNSGKSSIIQGLHFGIGLLQSVSLAGKWEASGPTLSTSLSPNQLTYAPSDDVYALGHGGRLLESKEQGISLDLTLGSGDSISVRVRKGRNRNILITIHNQTAAAALRSLERPFSIFSPGLAGIAKRETYASDGVLLRTLARGDANLVLRNILLRLWNTPAWNPFIDDLHEVFPGLEIRLMYNEKTDEFIDVAIASGNEWIPLEIAGTGVLQAIQILSYIHRFEPAIIVLDEPDSHLHPNNQRLLCALLRRVALDTRTQVLLTTHSRHVVDAIGGTSNFLWVRGGSVDTAGPDDEVAILMDVGALDLKERAGQPNIDAIVLTEDELTKPLELVLESSGFDLTRTVVLPYYGVTTVRNLRPLVNIIHGTNGKAKIVVHRDRDFLSIAEIEEWKKAIRAFGVEPFVPVGRDIEAAFLKPKYLADANRSITEKQAQDMVEAVVKDMRDNLIADYVNGRVEVARKSQLGGSLNHGALAVEAQKAINANPGMFCGKSVVRGVRGRFRDVLKANLATNVASAHLRDDALAGIAKKTFKTVSP